MADRNPNTGRFEPGNKASPGRKPRPTEAAYLDELKGRVTLQKWQKIADRAIGDAMGGDFRARQWVSDYLIGKPITTIDLRAGEQAQLSRILDLMKQRNVPASAVFEALIAELSTEAEMVESVEDDDDESG